jgi:hypothetical protein
MIVVVPAIVRMFILNEPMWLDRDIRRAISPFCPNAEDSDVFTLDSYRPTDQMVKSGVEHMIRILNGFDAVAERGSTPDGAVMVEATIGFRNPARLGLSFAAGRTNEILFSCLDKDPCDGHRAKDALNTQCPVPFPSDRMEIPAEVVMHHGLERRSAPYGAWVFESEEVVR